MDQLTSAISCEQLAAELAAGRTAGLDAPEKAQPCRFAADLGLSIGRGRPGTGHRL
jgi:hypothetical protein